MQAAFLRTKLPQLDRWNQDRKAIAKRYFEEITNPELVLPMQPNDEYDHIYHVFAIRCNRRDELEDYLKNYGIGTVKHYPIPMHMQPCYEELGIKEGDLPIAEEISRTILSIPMYYGMTEEEVTYVINVLNAFQ